MNRTLTLIAASLVMVALWTSTSVAEWPRIRVNNSYSLPSVPAQRPVFQAAPVILPSAPPGYVAPNYGTPVVPDISVPNTTYYAPGYAAPNYAPPNYAAPNYAAPRYIAPPAYGVNYAPAPTTSYYAPQPAFQPYQQPLPIQNYGPAMQPVGGYYQPNRPASFYSPTPGYHYPRSVFGGY